MSKTPEIVVEVIDKRDLQRKVIKYLLISAVGATWVYLYIQGYNTGKAADETVLPEPEVQSMLHVPHTKPSDEFRRIATIGTGV